jgi:hypothetical protein
MADGDVWIDHGAGGLQIHVVRERGLVEEPYELHHGNGGKANDDDDHEEEDEAPDEPVRDVVEPVKPVDGAVVAYQGSQLLNIGFSVTDLIGSS